MDNFSNKVQVFLDYFIHHDGYKTVHTCFLTYNCENSSPCFLWRKPL